MKGKYSPSALSLASRRCPGALQHQNDGAPRDRRVFSAGSSCHHIIEEVGYRTAKAGRVLNGAEINVIADDVASRLISKGRVWNGVPEGPMSADAVIAGRDLALGYLNEFPVLDVDGRDVRLVRIEEGLAVDADWNPVDYDSDSRRFRLILDQIMVVVEEDEDSAAKVARIIDYKSQQDAGAWLLDTLQMKAQAVVVWAHRERLGLGDVDVIRLEIVSLRTGRTWSREIWMGEDGPETLQAYRKDVTLEMDALDAAKGPDGRWACVPGGGCVGCPFALSCEAAEQYWARLSLGISASRNADVGELARALLWVNGARAELLRLLQDAAVEEPIEVDGPDGKTYRVGYHVADPPKERPRKGCGVDLLEAWRAQRGDVEGLVAHMQPGVTQLRNAAKALYPGKQQKAAREAFVDTLLEPYKSTTFAVRVVGSDPPADESED